MKEIIVDNFAGGGGASTGIELATGRSVDIAINHDPNAIAMHTTNHPDTLHYCESVFDIDPVAATAGRPVGLAWFSPDCRHFSKAKGSKPVKKEIRGLAWVVVRWALAKKPRVVMLENVEEFKTWGPLITAEDGTEHPDPARAGETFAAFVAMLTTGIAAAHPALQECCEVLGLDIKGAEAKQLVSGLGYVVDHRELRASDYGAPTIRKRFFMVMRCDGLPVVWPEPTHGDRLTAETLHKEGFATSQMIDLFESAKEHLQKAIENYTYATLAREKFFGSLSSDELDKTIKFLRDYADRIDNTDANKPIEYQGVGLDWLNAQDGAIH